jgi:hypothetical protein
LDSPKWFIACIMIWVFLTLIGNIVERVDYFTATQVAQLQGMTEMQTSEAADPTIGGVLIYGSPARNAIDAFLKAITADYSWLYKIDKTKTQSQCTAAGGKWNSTDSVCMLRNDYYIIWVLLYYPIMAGVLLSFILMLARLARGV